MNDFSVRTGFGEKIFAARSGSPRRRGTAAIASSVQGAISGGGWIQDYGVASTSNPPVAGLGTNYLVAVTSYGPVVTEPKYLGASNLDARFLDVLNHACGSNPGNC